VQFPDLRYGDFSTTIPKIAAPRQAPANRFKTPCLLRHITANVNTRTQNPARSAAARYLIGGESSAFAIFDVQLRVWPILAMIGLGLLVILPSGYLTFLFTKGMVMRRVNEMPWLALFANHAVMLMIALALIAWLTRGCLSEYGLQWPKQKSYVAKWKRAPYLPDQPSSWFKIRNRSYSQWLGREEFFERERQRNPDDHGWDHCVMRVRQ
jgi:hypothetical protein